MKVPAWALLGLALGGCGSAAAPDEEALERYHEANVLFEQGRYADAEVRYAFVIGVRDRILEAYRRLAYCREALGDEAGAIQALEALLRVDRQDRDALRHLARLYTHLGFVAEATEAWKAILAIGPEDSGARLELSRLEGLGR